MRNNQSSTNSAQSSLDQSMTIPEHDEFFTSVYSTPPNSQGGSNRQQNSTLSSPSMSISSLSSINNGPSAQSKLFRRSQTGSQLVPSKLWSRYALRQISLDSSTSSIASTTSSTAVLLPNQTTAEQNKNKYQVTDFLPSKSSSSIFTSEQKSAQDAATKRPKSSTVAGFEEKFVNLYTTGLSSDEDENSKNAVNDNDITPKHKRGYSVWRHGRSPGKQLRQIIRRSSSTGRLNNENAGQLNGSATLRPPFFAYKILPYLWLGNTKAANCDDLLSDGGCEYETRLIRRRVYVDFGVEKHQQLMNWPNKRLDLFDYLLPLPRRSKITKKLIFMTIIEFCKIVNKARGDGTQILAYGHSIDLAQFFSTAYLIVMFNKTPQNAIDLISSRAKSVTISDTLFEWLYELRGFLDRKGITIGCLHGDIIQVKNLEAERAYYRKYVVLRGTETTTPEYYKFINFEKTLDVSVSSRFFNRPPFPCEVPKEQKDCLSDNIDLNTDDSPMWHMPQRPKSRL